MVKESKQKLKNISPDEIEQNPENPRMVFRPRRDWTSLRLSIRSILGSKFQ